MRRKLKHDLVDFLELPLDISLDLPRVVILGELGVLISNHRGLLHYSPDRILVGVGRGQIMVSGQSLEIEEVSKESMAVRGIIKMVQMEN